MAGKGTRHRFELSRLEIAGVVISAATGLVVVFLLGIYAGRGLADRRVESGEQIVRLPVSPAAEKTPGTEDGLTFYDVLGQDERIANTGGLGAGDRRVALDTPPPAPPKEPPPVAAPEPTRVVPSAAPAKVEPSVKMEPPTKPAKDPVRPAPAAAPSPAVVTKAERAPAPSATKPVAVALAPPAAVPTPRSPSRGNWSVQVSATRDPRTADTVLRRLRTKGYDAFVLKVRRQGETFYRVRVGHYGSLEDAQQVVSRLRREPGVPEAFVASD